MGIRLEKTRTSYSIEVPREKATALFEMEPSLLTKLKLVTGVTEVNYDAMFGPYVFVTIDVEDDTPDTHASIRTVVGSALKDCG